MVRRRLFASPLPAAPAQLTLGDESRHHAQVLRLAAGDELRLFDAAGREADARVVRVDRRSLVCDVEAAVLVPIRSPQLHLALGVPKPAKLELIVRMATELGVSSIALVQTARAVPKWGGEGDAKLERLQRIAIEACAQSEQAYTPLLRAPVPLAAAVANVPSSAFKCAFVERTRTPLPRTLAADLPEVWAFVGPEGGFDTDEIELLAAHGAALVSLGQAILRVETACVVACALLLDRLAQPA